MNKAVFMKKFGGVFEHSPWVADAVFSTQTKASMENSDALSDGFKQVFLESAREPQLETLRAHPQLVCGLAEPAELTVDSVSEQLGSGLDECTPAEFAEFGRLNTAYMEKFGFPFIIAVRGRDRQGILRMFRLRLQNDAVLEYQSALLQVCQIARLRIGDILSA
jgi:2-oxo-4-hydroxy-4-carboxy-5-ureidoimidazoline decarboxylase